MNSIKEVAQYLGAPYSIRVIDFEEVIYRDLGNGIDFEVSGVRSGHTAYTVYVWRTTPHKEIIGKYCGVKGPERLKDLLGYLSVIYQNLRDGIQVEREELPE